MLLREDKRRLNLQDYGAGSLVNKDLERTIANIARHTPVLPSVGRWLFRIVNGARWLDRHLEQCGRQKAAAWFADQYRHPHESKHTFAEVRRWFGRCEFAWISSIPQSAGAPINIGHRIFQPERFGNAAERFLVALSMIFSGHREGGLFVVVGQKKFKKFLAPIGQGC